MILRKNTKKVKVGTTFIGNSNEVLIQSMCNIKTSNTEEVIKQINRCEALGAKLMRVSVLDEEDALSIKEIKKNINIPLIADIHFNYKFAILAMENGADKIRINPGNIGKFKEIKQIIECAKKYKVAIRIGVNSGSMDQEIYDYKSKLNAKLMIKSLKKHLKIFKKLKFNDIVVSLKSSDVNTTIEAYKLAAKMIKYPLHLGLTEAGNKETAIIRSCAALSPLLSMGIGNTIRISITCEPEEEIIVAKKLLHDLGLYPNYPTFISCPTCGRTQVNLQKLSNDIQKYLEKVNKNIVVAIMGCVVNGPGEAKNADIGIAGGKNSYVLFKKGQIIKKINESEAYDSLIEEINNF